MLTKITRRGRQKRTHERSGGCLGRWLAIISPMPHASCHDLFIVIVFHVVQEDLLEPGLGMGTWE